MGLKYRWMQKKDLDKIGKHKKSFISLLKENRTIANVVELDDEIMGWVVYRLLEDKISIIKIAFCNEQAKELIMQQIIKKSSNKDVEITVSEYDLRMHLLLKSKNFRAIDIKKTRDLDFYKFVLNRTEK